MNLQDIQDAINSIENDTTNAKNVHELASLYICRDHLQKSNNQQYSTENELNDIFPQYKHYCDIKRRYQLKEVTEDAVVQEMKVLAKEIAEFLLILYSNTDFYKERKILAAMIEGLNFK